MALRDGSLSDGQIAAAWGVLHTASSQTFVMSIHIYNAGSSVEVVDLGVTRSGSTRRQIRKMRLKAGDSGFMGGLHLSEGDTIDGRSTNALSVDYVITGPE